PDAPGHLRRVRRHALERGVAVADDGGVEGGDAGGVGGGGEAEGERHGQRVSPGGTPSGYSSAMASSIRAIRFSGLGWVERNSGPRAPPPACASFAITEAIARGS